MTSTYDRRSEENSDLRRIYDQISALGTVVGNNHITTIQALGDMRGAFQVHVAEDKIVADKVRDHEVKWKEIDVLKNRGLVYLILGFLAAGGMGGGAAHIAKKFIE